MNWQYFEQWATAKAIKFSMTDEWIDFVLSIVSKRVVAERKSKLFNQSDLD